MRTLLFVQNEDWKRPKVAWYGRHAHHFAGVFKRDEARNVEAALRGSAGDYVPRWWLVEAESAEAARTIIRGVPGHMHTGNTCNTCSAYQFNGRILASGGRHAS